MDESLKPLEGLRNESAFHVLVVDDDAVAAHLFREVMKNLRHRYELHFVRDGVDALDFLYRREPYARSPRPNLVLLDLNMPRLGGLETLSAIKSDPELCVIPVIVLSTSGSPDDVRQSYLAHANCYVQKPADLEQSTKLVQAVEAFWVEFALLARAERMPQYRDSKGFPSEPPARPDRFQSGHPIASIPPEARSRAMHTDGSPKGTEQPQNPGCELHSRLLKEFGVAVGGLIELHEQQFLAIVEGDADCHRFDLLIHMANEKRQLAKYACLRHVEAHRCSN